MLCKETVVQHSQSADAPCTPFPVTPPPLHAQITAQLTQTVQRRGAQEAKLATAQLCAAALIAVQPDSFSYSSSGLRVLRALARAPVRLLTPETLRLSQFCWCWVSVLWQPLRVG
jgi:hypothetical protein